ncbi:Glu/Leu/Phe/Val dehydrogenase dimerization domain-containing protein [Streptomyces armeniacus]|uniref:Glu/Leu/Phe/Val dehydrogenase dimerization domain-containing protein n=1 Tax=Streptomyces armeniacus TaxID=83291 RepID=UPI001C9AFA78
MPSHKPFLQVTWDDDQTSARGFVVIDQLVTGIATGGMRMRPGCTLGEVNELAREMTLKMAAFGIHVGGAKGGIDFDPADPRAEEVRERFVRAVRPLLERFWVTAGDLGTRQEQLDATFERVGLGDTSFHAAVLRAGDETEVRARIRQAFDTHTDGLKLSELVGGFGVAEAALAALEHRGIPAANARAAVQGFGAMGGSTALYLARAGVRIVGITDSRGLIVNTSRGLDVESLLAARDEAGVIDRSVLREDDAEEPGDTWLGQEVDVLVPAAVSYAITPDNCDRIRAGLVVEAANVPTTAEAERALLARGVTVIPDFVANTGAAAGAWWVILGEVVSPSGACGRLSAQMRPLVRRLMAEADAGGVSTRDAAVRFARDNARRLAGEFGSVVAFRDLYSGTQQEQQDRREDGGPGRAPAVPVAVADPAPADGPAAQPQPACPSSAADPDLAEVLDGPAPAGRQTADTLPAYSAAYWPGPAEGDAGRRP